MSEGKMFMTGLIFFSLEILFLAQSSSMQLFGSATFAVSIPSVASGAPSSLGPSCSYVGSSIPLIGSLLSIISSSICSTYNTVSSTVAAITYLVEVIEAISITLFQIITLPVQFLVIIGSIMFNYNVYVSALNIIILIGMVYDLIHGLM